MPFLAKVPTSFFPKNKKTDFFYITECINIQYCDKLLEFIKSNDNELNLHILPSTMHFTMRLKRILSTPSLYKALYTPLQVYCLTVINFYSYELFFQFHLAFRHCLGSNIDFWQKSKLIGKHWEECTSTQHRIPPPPQLISPVSTHEYHTTFLIFIMYKD